MKKIIYLLALLAIIHVSCSDFLELSPTDQFAAGNMWTSETTADNGIIGIYAKLYATSLGSPQLSRSDGLNRQGIEGMSFATDYYSNNYPVRLLSYSDKRASDWQIAHEWKFCYTIVHSCNDAIANLHRAGLSPEKFERYQSEARFMRAWAYNRLNMLFQGVPIYLEPVNNEETVRTQASADEVWQVIIDDLTYCIDNQHLADNTLGATNYGRPSKGAAYAMRGMVYMWKKEFGMAIKDFEKVKSSGYGLWNGEYVELFKFENEKHKEMIFPLQFSEEDGWSDNIQLIMGARDTYNGWTEIKPSTDFVDYYQNADGSKFLWKEVVGLEDWDLLTPAQREVFFCRDGLNTNSKLASLKSGVVKRVGQHVYDKYYLDKGNEARVKEAYENRDPRLKQTVLTPYEPVDCCVTTYNGGKLQRGKQARWPLFERGYDGGDFWLDKRFSAFYCYRKYVEYDQGRLIYSNRCHTDWPLIRFTHVHLMHAEALAQENDIAGAISLINDIRTRAHMPKLVNGGGGPNGVASKEDMLEKIRYESRIEMCVESVNYFDEVRWGTYKESKFQGNNENGGKSWWGDMTEYAWYYSDTMWPWSAPKAEIERNPNIKKREGWVY